MGAILPTLMKYLRNDHSDNDSSCGVTCHYENLFAYGYSRKQFNHSYAIKHATIIFIL